MPNQPIVNVYIGYAYLASRQRKSFKRFASSTEA